MNVAGGSSRMIIMSDLPDYWFLFNMPAVYQVIILDVSHRIRSNSLDRFHSMKVYSCVVAQGGFTAAAKVLHLTPQMVSHHIKTLESYLGVRLLSRTTRKLSLTDIGRQYLVHCHEILKKIEVSETEIRQSSDSPAGLLKICAAITFGSIKVAPAIVEFSQRFAKVRVDLSLSDQRQDLVGESIDIAFRIGKLADSNFIARPLQNYSMMLAASPNYIAEYGQPIDVEDLKNHRCLLQRFDNTSGHWPLVDNAPTINVDGPLRADHGGALYHQALVGGGIILQPTVLLESAVKDGKLIPLLPNVALPSQPMHLLYSAQGKLEPKVAAFIDFALSKWQ